MADFTWPFEPDRDFAPEAYDEAMEFNVELSVARSGRVSTQSLPGARWRTRLAFPAVPVSQLVQRRQLEAFFLQQRGGADRLLLWNLQTPEPLGTLRGAPTLGATVAAGASTAQLVGCTAGANVFTPAVLSQQWLDGWTTTNATLAYNSVAGPVAGSLATTVTRTATGNHLIARSFTLASTALRSLKFAIWLKAGTYTGNVRIIIADGSAGNQIIKTVALTGSWALEFVAGAFPVSPAANVNVYVDPVDDAGSGGETFFAWFADLQVQQALVFNAYLVPGAEAPPAGLLGLGDQLVRVATGDHYSYRTVLRSVAAGEVWTYSVWLRLVTLTGTVTLQVHDNSGTTIATTTVTPTASWQRFSVTATFPSAVAGVRGVINPTNNTGSVGDILAVYGEQIEPGPTVTDHQPFTTLLRGDRIAFGGQRVVLTADAEANAAGACTVSFQPAHRTGAASAAVVTVVKPTTRYVMAQPVVQMSAQGGVLPGFAVELVEE